jgi:hypothetical protein
MSRFAVEDAELPVGAVAVFRICSIPSSSRSEPSSRACGSISFSVADQLQHRMRFAARGEVHQRRSSPVPAGEPLVLRREDAVVRRDLLAALEALGEELHEGLAVRDDGRRRPRAA